jgi:glutamate formiminotransferase
MAAGGRRGTAVFEAVPNFSEGRDDEVLADLAAGPDVLDVHTDADHHRSVVTLAHANLERLAEAVLEKVAVAVERIDLRRHAGVHPRVGAADVVPIVPLGGASMAEAVAAARRLAERVWRELRIAVYLYGDAAGGRRLADVRAGRVRPDLGGEPHPTAGAVCVGARPPLVAYNLAFEGLDLLQAARAVAALRRLPGVQALAFRLGDGRVQLSMNLTRLDATAVPAAHDAALRLAGLPARPELVGLCPAAAAGPGCDGGLLEARLAGAAARGAAADALARGGGEMARLARRLDAEARALAALPIAQDDLLDGAERAAALARVLRAAGLATADREALLDCSARGLRSALAAATAGRFARRVALLDRWLE